MLKQSRRKLMHYVLSKFKLSKKGNDFGTSITQSLSAYYGPGLDSANKQSSTPFLDRRLSLPFAKDIVDLILPDWGRRQSNGNVPKLDSDSPSSTSLRQPTDHSRFGRNRLYRSSDHPAACLGRSLGTTNGPRSAKSPSFFAEVTTRRRRGRPFSSR